MALDKQETIDAIGIEEATGRVILTIADSWPWDDEQGHLLALQAKLNAYFNFIESGPDMGLVSPSDWKAFGN